MIYFNFMIISIHAHWRQWVQFVCYFENQSISRDDCGAPIQNTTAELLTISQLLVKDAYRPEPKPMADLFDFDCFVCFSNSWFKRRRLPPKGDTKIIGSL